MIDGPLAVQHGLLGVGREHDDDVDLAVGELRARLVLAGDHPLGVDELGQLALVRLVQLLVDRPGRTDEERLLDDDVLGVSGAEQQQQRERPDHEQRDQPWLADDLDDLFADERERADHRPPGRVHRAQPGRGSPAVMTSASLGVSAACSARWRSTTRTNASS